MAQKAAKEAPELKKMRKIIAGLPETSEKLSHGAPTFWGGKKTFASFHANHHGDGRWAIWLKLPPGAQETLVEADPVRFYRPPYVGPAGWVGIDLRSGGKVDWDLVASLLEDGYRTVAPKRAIAKLDGEG